MNSTGFTLVELLLGLVIFALVSVAALHLVSTNQLALLAMQDRSQTLQSAVVASELLKQASWKAGNATSVYQPTNPLRMSGSAPSSHLHISYALDESGYFTDYNCSGNRRSSGASIRISTDDLYARALQYDDNPTAELYCLPNTGVGSSLVSRVNGMHFSVVQTDTEFFAEDTNIFYHLANRDNNKFTRAVIAEIVVKSAGLDKNVQPQNIPFNWQPLVTNTGQPLLAWRLFLPTSIDFRYNINR